MHLYHPFLMVAFKKEKNVVIFAIHDVVHGPLNTMWHFIQLELQL
jgi:hypothetical protein